MCPYGIDDTTCNVLFAMHLLLKSIYSLADLIYIVLYR